MDKVWLSIFIVTTIFISTELTSLETAYGNNKNFSSDSQYPIVYQEVNISSNSINNGTVEDKNTTVSNATCIRRDYEQNISAIFINNVGPILNASKIFNSTNYEFFNAEYYENINQTRALYDKVVDCEEYGVTTHVNGSLFEEVTYSLSTGTIASLVG